MTAIYVDERVFAPADDSPLPFIRARMASLVSGTEPTDFGWWLLELMARHDPPLSQTQLADLIGGGVTQSTISRWIHRPSRPDYARLARAAEVLGVPAAEMHRRAGYTAAAADTNTGTGLHPAAAALQDLLGPASTLPEGERKSLEAVLDGLIATYRRRTSPRRGRRGA